MAHPSSPARGFIGVSVQGASYDALPLFPHEDVVTYGGVLNMCSLLDSAFLCDAAVCWGTLVPPGCAP